MTFTLPRGTNVRLLFQDCRCDDRLLNQPEAVIESVRDAVLQAEMQALSDAAHSFDGGGYTLAVILSESHVVIHTWPEMERMVLVEISICDFKKPNQWKAVQLGERLEQLYLPGKCLREHASMIPRLIKTTLSAHGHYVEIDSLLHSRQNAKQRMDIIQTSLFGKALVVDGVLQTTEVDDAFYHEPLVHIPMLAHPNPQSVLICGGGDGGAAKEVLKHPCVESCTVVDYDEDIIALAKDHLSEFNHHCFDDKRCAITIDDANTFIANSETRYDVILLDMTDPTGTDELFLNEAFYDGAEHLLNKDGCLALHFGSPFLINDEVYQTILQIRDCFSSAVPYFHFVPSNGTLVGFMVCFKTDSPSTNPSLHLIDSMLERLLHRQLHDLKTIDADSLPSLFSLPPWLKKKFEW